MKPFFLMRSLFSTYLSNPTFKALCSAEAFLSQMARVEVALAKAQAAENIISQEAAEEIAKVLPQLQVDLDLLANDIAKNGIPTIGYLVQAKMHLSKEAAEFLHWGVTSQDITDTALVLVLQTVHTEIRQQLSYLIQAFEELEAKYGGVEMAARTRNQMAVPILFSQKIASWKQPLKIHLRRLDEMEERLFRLQLFGADGSFSVLGNQAEAVQKGVAKELQLKLNGPWHSQREGLTEFSDQLSSISATLAKFGSDMLTLSQSEVGELAEGLQAGSSSSMPHKNNPVKSEALVALAQFAIDLSAGLKRAQIHKNERDGVSLAAEWLIWPTLLETVGAAIFHALSIAKNLQVNTQKMQQNIDEQNGLLYSETATYLLAKNLGRNQAKQKVAEASQLAIATNISLEEALRITVPNSTIDWKNQLKKS